MQRSSPRMVAAALHLGLAIAACGGAGRAPMRSAGTQPIMSPAAQARADSGRPRYTAADVHFMTGMIPHHAQAVLIAGWAATHGAGADVRILAERIAVAQRDEIATMQRWLRERRQTVPDADATHMTMTMNGVTHDMLMPGMLTAEQLAQLDSARGPAFDRLFLTFMIQHHQGALAMAEQLFNSYGAAYDDTIFKFASDLQADQSTEIDRMERMLAAQASGGRSP